MLDLDLAVFLNELKDTAVLYYAVVCSLPFASQLGLRFVSNNFVSRFLQELCTPRAVPGFTNMTSCQTRLALPRMPLTAHRAMTKKKGFSTMADARRREGWHFQQIRASSELEADPSRDKDSKPQKSQHNQLQVPSGKEVVLSSISAFGAAMEETTSTVQKQHPLSRERDHTPRALLLLGGLLIAVACALLSPKAAVASQKLGPVKTTSTQQIRILKERSREAGKTHSLSSTTLSQLHMLDVGGYSCPVNSQTTFERVIDAAEELVKSIMRSRSHQ
jgi:hypothetical protein